MDMHSRLINLRDRIQVSHRLSFKAKMLQERRKRIIEHLPPIDEANKNQMLQPSEEDIGRMVANGDVREISKLFRVPIEQMRDLLSRHSRQFLQLARGCLIGERRIQALCVIGNIAATDYFDSTIIDQTALLELIQLFSETSAPQQLKVFFCLFRDLYRHANPHDIFIKVCQHYTRIESALNDFPVEFLEMINEFKVPELQPSEQLVRRIIERKFRPEQPVDTLMEILQIVERQLRPLPHYEELLSPFHHSEEHHTSRFHYYVLEFILASIPNLFKLEVKAQLIELVGVVISSRNTEDMVDYILGHRILDELIVRSKVDYHLPKLASVSSLCTLTVFCMQVPIHFMQRRQLEVLVKKGFHEVLVLSMQYNQPEVLLKVLKAVTKLLMNGFKQQLAKLRVEQLLDRLQKHPNKAVYEFTELLISEYFEEEFY